MTGQVEWRRRAWALETLIACLRRTALRDPPDSVPIAIPDRARVIDAIESAIAKARALPDPPVSKAHIERLAFTYFITIDDDDRGKLSLSALREVGDKPQEDKALVTARALLREGRLEDALAAVEDDGSTPWIAAHKIVLLLGSENREDDALERALEASTTWPDIAPLRSETARLLMRARRHEEALCHADKAFGLLPGRGQRVLLAQALAAVGKRTESWTVLLPLADVESSNVMRVRAYVAEEASAGAAIGLWQRYLNRVPNDASARLRLARLLFAGGQANDAAGEAWRAFEASSDDLLPPEDLEFCAVLQDKSNLQSATVEERLTAIATELRRRFPGVVGAERAYLRIWSKLGGPSHLSAPDFLMLQSSGDISSVPVEEVAQILTGAAQAVDAADSAYASGILSFETLCRLTGSSAEMTLARYRRMRRMLSTPFDANNEVRPLNGSEILLGDLELLLFGRLGVLERFRDLVLAENARLVVFDDVRDRILQANAIGGVAILRGQIDALEAVRVELNSHTYVHSIQPEQDDGVFARAHDGTLLFHRASEDTDSGVDVGAAIRWLTDEGYIPRRGNLGDERLPKEVAAGRLFLTIAAAQELLKSDAWLGFVDAFRGRISIGPEAHSALAGQLTALQDRYGSAVLVNAVHAFVGDGATNGWVGFEKRPDIADLPPARDVGLQDVRAVVKETASWREALVAHPQRVLLTADFLVAGLFVGASPIDLLMPLQWDVGTYEKRVERARTVQSQELSFARLARRLQSESGPNGLAQLLEWGMADAANSGDLISWARDYQGLRKARPTQWLDMLEATAGPTNATKALVARAGIARLYAEAIWAWGTGPETAEPTRISGELLERAERLGSDIFGGTLGTTMRFLVALAASTPRLSFIPGDNEMYSLSREAPAGRLFGEVADWCESSDTRKSALVRAIAQNLIILDEVASEAGPSQVNLAPFLLASNEVRRFSPSNERTLVDEAMAILSAGWSFRPLDDVEIELRGEATTVSVEQVLITGAQLLREDRTQIMDAGTHWSVPISIGSRTLGVAAPPEATFLRMPTSDMVGGAGQLVRTLGTKDGRVVGLLERLAQSGWSEALRREFARKSVTAPWRLVVHDPLELIRWGQLAHEAVSFPATIQDLRAMLSEPGPFPPDGRVMEVLNGRCVAGGPWAARADVDLLLEQSSLLPGISSAVALAARRNVAISESEAASAFLRLRASEDLTTGQIVSDILLLRVASAQGLAIDRDGKAVSVAGLWADAVGELLETIGVSRPEGTMADTEDSLLCVCAWIVERLGTRQPLPARDGLWLTFRLFQWATQCLDLNGLRKVIAGAANFTRATKPLPEVLDPIRFGRTRYDHRVASVLLAVQQAPIAARMVGSPEAAAGPDILWSERLGLSVAALAERPLCDEEEELRKIDNPNDCLGWNSSVAAVPDIACSLLLGRDRGRLAQLNAEILRDRIDKTLVAGFASAGTAQRLRLEEIGIMSAIQRPDLVEAGSRQALGQKVVEMESRGLDPGLGFMLLGAFFSQGDASLLPLLRDRVASSGAEERPERVRTLLLVTAVESLEAEVEALEQMSGASAAEVLGALVAAVESLPIEYVGAAQRIVLAERPHVPSVAKLELQRRLDARRSFLETVEPETPTKSEPEPNS